MWFALFSIIFYILSLLLIAPFLMNSSEGKLSQSKTPFFLTALAAIILLPPWWKIIPALFLLLRLLIVELKIWRIGKRLGERKLAGTYILYDLTSPLGECFLALSRRLRPNRAVWR